MENQNGFVTIEKKTNSDSGQLYLLEHGHSPGSHFHKILQKKTTAITESDVNLGPDLDRSLWIKRFDRISFFPRS